MKVESKQVTARCSAERLYGFACDFRNFQRFLPQQVENFTSDGNTCSFTVSGFIQLTLQYAERSPYHTVALAPAAGSNSPVPFRMVLSISAVDDTSCHAVIGAEISGGNPLIAMTLKPKLKPALDQIADQLQYYSSGI